MDHNISASVFCLLLLLLTSSVTAAASDATSRPVLSDENNAIENEAQFPISFSGSNTQVTSPFYCNAGLLYVSWTVDDGLFSIELVDDQGDHVSYLASQYDEGSGSSVTNVPHAGYYMLKVSASSPWTATLSTALYSTQQTSFSGSNDFATPAFYCNAGRLDVSWTVDDGLFWIELVDDQGESVAYIASQYDGGPGSTVTNVPRSGYYMLKISADSPWTVMLSKTAQTPPVTPTPATGSTFSGLNSQATPSFYCNAGLLHVSWTVDDGLFSIELVDDQGEYVDYLASQYDGGPGSTVTNVPRSGYYMLKVSASSPWTATLSTALYSTQQTSFSGSNDYATPAFYCNAGRLDVSWTVDDGLFWIELVDDQGKLVDFVASVYDSESGSTVTNVPRAGYYLLSVSASSPWTVTLRSGVQSPPSGITPLPQVPSSMPTPSTVTIPVSPVAQSPTSPTVTPSSWWGKRYGIGDPGSYLEKRSGVGGQVVILDPRAVMTPEETLKPGSFSYGVNPPKEQFIRWYPSARWNGR